VAAAVVTFFQLMLGVCGCEGMFTLLLKHYYPPSLIHSKLTDGRSSSRPRRTDTNCNHEFARFFVLTEWWTFTNCNHELVRPFDPPLLCLRTVRTFFCSLITETHKAAVIATHPPTMLLRKRKGPTTNQELAKGERTEETTSPQGFTTQYGGVVNKKKTSKQPVRNSTRRKANRRTSCKQKHKKTHQEGSSLFIFQ